MNLLEQLAEAVIKGKAPDAEALTKQALDQGMDALTVLNKGLIAGMDVVGVKFRNNEYYVPEVLISARAMKAAMKILRPILAQTGVQPVGKFLIGTVRGDIHDIGKNLVAMMLEGAGFEIIDLGIDAAPEKFIAAIQEHQPNALGMSAMLTTTMGNMKVTIDAIAAAELRDKVKIFVGGAPVNERFANEIGADGYAPDAASAVTKVKEVLKIG